MRRSDRERRVQPPRDGRTHLGVERLHVCLDLGTVRSSTPAEVEGDADAVAVAAIEDLPWPADLDAWRAALASSPLVAVTADGVGVRTFNVSDNGAAFGVANGSEVSVIDLLLAVDSRSKNGLLFDLDGDGDADDPLETDRRTMANTLFSAINEAGDV